MEDNYLLKVSQVGMKYGNHLYLVRVGVKDRLNSYYILLFCC